MFDGAGITQILLGVIAFFLIRLIKQVDDSSKSLKDLSTAVGNLSMAVEHSQRERVADIEQVHRALKEHHEEIEMLRQRTHDNLNYLTSMRLQGEMKNGWTFTGVKWDLAAVITEKD